MKIALRASRCIIGVLLASWIGAELPGVKWILGWPRGLTPLNDALVVLLIGIVVGAVVAMCLSIGESAPAWPVGAFMAAIMLDMLTSVIDIATPAEHGGSLPPTPSLYLWWALVILGPAIGAAIVLAGLRLRGRENPASQSAA